MILTYACPTCERPVEVLTERLDGGRFGGTLSCPCGDNYDVAFIVERDDAGIVEEIELIRCTPSAPAIQDFIVQDFPDQLPHPDADWYAASREAANERKMWRL